VYDRWGNRLIDLRSNIGQSTQEPTAFNAANQATGSNWGYDGGNLTKDPVATYAYDAENRVVAYCPQDTVAANCVPVEGNGRTIYSYDGEGHRVLRQGSAKTAYIYDGSGALAAEYGPPNSGDVTDTLYLTTDHLGSTRVIAKADGAVVSRHDYRPFGPEIPKGATGLRSTIAEYDVDTGVRPQFTGKERDVEAGLDYFGARYFSAAQGRFTSPDEPLADQDPGDPQSWNLYGYVRNNPLRFTDPSGRECVTLDNGTQGDDGKGTVCKAVTEADKNKKPDVTVTDFEPPSPLLLAVAQGAQQAGPVVNAAGYATMGVMTGAGIGMALGTGATASLSMLAARAGGMLPIALPAGDKMRQMIARFGISGGPQALQQFASEFREKAIAAGTYVQGYYLGTNKTIFRVGNDYLTVNSQGRMVSFVKDAAASSTTLQRVTEVYKSLGGK
jgi:RHS repeat-associated protein